MRPGKDTYRPSNAMKPNPIIQSVFISGLFGAKVDGISLMQAHPRDTGTLIDLQPSDTAVAQPKLTEIPSAATRRKSGRAKQKPAFSAEETRHHFAIEALDKCGPSRPRPYLYTCVRCMWIFRVNDSRGSVIALDGLGRRLLEPENSKRVVTFGGGPCPACPVFEHSVAESPCEIGFCDYMSRSVAAVRRLTQLGRRTRQARKDPDGRMTLSASGTSTPSPK
jgi:hypothetical protein